MLFCRGAHRWDDYDDWPLVAAGTFPVFQVPGGRLAVVSQGNYTKWQLHPSAL